MSYRDELDATRARADALERELADARRQVAELQGESTAVATRNAGALARRGTDALERAAAGSATAARWLGAPTRLELERELPGELPESAHTEVVEAIRRMVGEPGTTTALPGSLTWSAGGAPSSTGPFVNVYITIRDGTTHVRVDDKLGNLAGAIWGGVGGGVGGGGIMVPMTAAWFAPMLLPITLPMWLGGTYLACRKLYRGRAAKRAARLGSIVDAIADIAARRIADATADGDASEA